MTIQVKALRKSFGQAPAVDGIDLDINEGEMLVLLGPSGCGKTTTMRCIAGLEEPDSGWIGIDGKAVFDSEKRIHVPVNKRNVGMVFQSYAIWPHMSVYENVAFPLEMARVAAPDARKRVMETLDLVGLSELAERGASYLSGGQMQRVALARSLAMRPSVLLFDEPLSNLDARLRDHLRVQLREIQTQTRITSIYVTHDQREALALADRIVVMRSGVILQTGSPVEIYNAPLTSEIAEFLGYSNIFPATPAGAGQSGHGYTLRSGQRRIVSATRPPDGACSICVRPDDIEIHGAGAAAQDDANNRVEGKISLASFMGSHMQYRIRTSTGEVWEVLDANTRRLFKLGENVELRIATEKVKALPDQ